MYIGANQLRPTSGAKLISSHIKITSYKEGSTNAGKHRGNVPEDANILLAGTLAGDEVHRDDQDAAR